MFSKNAKQSQGKHLDSPGCLRPGVKLERMQPETQIKYKFKKLWKNYIFQSSLAAVALLILTLLGREKMVLISSMGATAFIVFAMPNVVSAGTKNVIGGHLVGLICGTVFFFTSFPYYIEYPLVIALAVFIMVALDLEHPPAAGTALAVVINEVSGVNAFVTIMLSAVVLSMARRYLRPWLKDLI